MDTLVKVDYGIYKLGLTDYNIMLEKVQKGQIDEAKKYVRTHGMYVGHVDYTF